MAAAVLTDRDVFAAFKAGGCAGALEPAALAAVRNLAVASARGDSDRARRLVDRIFAAIRTQLDRETGAPCARPRDGCAMRPSASRPPARSHP